LNQRTTEIVKKHKEKCRGLFWIKPSTEEFSGSVKKFYLKNSEYFSGLKIHPYHSRLPVSDKRCKPYLEFAEQYSLAVAVHTADDVYSRSENVYNISKDYPNVKFILVHLDLISDNKKAIDFISKTKNIYGDSTWVKTSSIIRAIKECGSDKIIFGTDNPIDGIDTYMKYQDMISTIKDTFSQSDCDNFFYKNAVKLFLLKLNFTY